MTVRRSAQRKVQGKPCPSATLQPWANRRQEGFRGWSRWPGGTTQGSNTGSCMGTLGGQPLGPREAQIPSQLGRTRLPPVAVCGSGSKGGRRFFPARAATTAWAGDSLGAQSLTGLFIHQGDGTQDRESLPRLKK